MIRIMTSNATRAVLNMLARDFERKAGHQVVVDHASAAVMLERIRNGEVADVAVLNAPDIDELIGVGTLVSETRRPFARSSIAVAVRAGTPHPDISTADALKVTLLEARSVAHTLHGASGRYVPVLFQRLGISPHASPKIVTRDGGLIGELVAAGEADIAIQQLSELLSVTGIEVVGPLPPEVQKTIDSAAAIFADSPQRSAAEAFLRLCAAPSSAAAFRERGLDQTANDE